MTRRQPGVWKRAVLWLALLAPFFFISYGVATSISAQRYLHGGVGTLVFAWESQVPFWAWTIIPYWSIDILYGFSLLACFTRRELDNHALRLLSAQVIAVTCFLIWPLRFTFERPELSGVFGWLFAVLTGFDKPFNQAPSLHIALLVVLWVCYDRYLRSFHHVWRWLLHGWFLMIGLSVLTTWQHHFIDVPTGALAGWFCVWLWPDEGRSPLMSARLTRDLKRRKFALFYALSAGLFTALAFSLQGAWLWACWPAFSLMMVSLTYLLFDAAGFQKRVDGGMSPASRWIFAPYRIGAWINSRLWTYRHPDADLIVDNVYLGRIPDRSQLKRFNAVVDMCAELPLAAPGQAYRSVPTLDLVAPAPLICLTAARVIEDFAGRGPILVCCALGYSRSATAVAAWLIYSGRALTVTEAVEIIRRGRPDVVIRSQHHAALTAMLQLSVESANV